MTDEARAGEPRPPIAGMWVVSSDDELTPAIVESAKELLEGAAAEGKQVVVVEGITFRWRPVEVAAAAPALDPDLLAQSLDIAFVVRHRIDGTDWKGDLEEVAKVAAAEYARLESAPPVAPLGEE